MGKDVQVTNAAEQAGLGVRLASSDILVGVQTGKHFFVDFGHTVTEGDASQRHEGIGSGVNVTGTGRIRSFCEAVTDVGFIVDGLLNVRLLAKDQLGL
uniref:Uncharacterized protein n=1 Tax=Anopheles atroparvus TaxID=41427 RepID=A0AAG5DQV2_ANOAO